MAREDPHFTLTVIPGSGPPIKLSGKLGPDPQTSVLGGPLDLRARVTSLSYEDCERETDKLVFTVDNYTLRLFSSRLFWTGSTVRASWGYPGDMSPTRECVPQKIEGFEVLNVTCYGRDALMNKVQRARVFANKTRHQVVAQVAEECGFGPEARHVEEDPTGEVLETLPQARLTDAGLLRALAAEVGFVFYVDHDGLHWHRRRTDQRPTRRYEYFAAKRRGEVLSFKVTSSLFERKSGGVTAKGVDPATKKPVVASGDNASSEQPALASVRDLFTGVSGRDGTELATTERATGSSTVAPTSGSTPTAKGAQVAAIGAYDKHQFAAAKATLEVVGDPKAAAKAPVELVEADACGGLWWAKKVTHKLGSGGYKTTYELAREAPTTKSTVAAKAGANASKPLPPTDPSSIFHDPGGTTLVSGRDGSVSFADQPAQGAGADADLTAWYR